MLTFIRNIPHHIAAYVTDGIAPPPDTNPYADLPPYPAYKGEKLTPIPSATR